MKNSYMIVALLCLLSSGYAVSTNVYGGCNSVCSINCCQDKSCSDSDTDCCSDSDSDDCEAGQRGDYSDYAAQFITEDAQGAVNKSIKLCQNTACWQLFDQWAKEDAQRSIERKQELLRLGEFNAQELEVLKSFVALEKSLVPEDFEGMFNLALEFFNEYGFPEGLNVMRLNEESPRYAPLVVYFRNIMQALDNNMALYYALDTRLRSIVAPVVQDATKSGDLLSRHMPMIKAIFTALGHEVAAQNAALEGRMSELKA